MARKITTLTLVACTLFTLLATGCKKNDWLDWKTQNEVILKNNKSKPGVKTTASGLQYRIITDEFTMEARPHANSMVTVTYGLRLPANNYARTDTATSANMAMFNLINGFQEGMKKIHQNGIIEMWIPYDLGYGEDGYGNEGAYNYIPPFTTLYFYVRLEHVENY